MKNYISNDILVSTSTNKIEYYHSPEHNKIAYIFSDLASWKLDGLLPGGNLYLKNGFDLIAFKVSNHDWHQQTPESIFKIINSETNKKNYIKKIAYGCSAGGYAALAFSKQLDLDTVITISPQFSINEDWDKRWEPFAKKIQFKYLISKDTLNPDCNYYFIYDDKDDDKLHVEEIIKNIQSQKIRQIKIPYSCHPTVYYLSETGLLKDVILKISNENNIDGINFKANKKISKTYLRGLSGHLLAKRHFTLSLKVINAALELDNKKAEFYAFKSVILEKTNRLEEAIKNINKAIILEPSNNYFANSYDNLVNIIKKQDANNNR